MKKAFITLAAIVGVMAAATTANAAGITFEDAQKKALEAVTVKEEEVIFMPTEADTDDGRQVYEVNFFVPGEIKYEFDIDMNTGAIVEQDIDLWEADDDMEYAALIEAAQKQTDKAAAAAETIEGEITERQAKMIALVDAGLKADEVTFTRCRREVDDGVTKFEVKLRLADGTEYDFDINAADGTILERDVDFD